jgi:hypothetical protein
MQKMKYGGNRLGEARSQRPRTARHSMISFAMGPNSKQKQTQTKAKATKMCGAWRTRHVRDVEHAVEDAGMGWHSLCQRHQHRVLLRPLQQQLH